MAGPPLLGREAELTHAETMLASARAGRGGGLMCGAVPASGRQGCSTRAPRCVGEVLNALLVVIAGLAEPGSLVLALDDIDLADRASLRIGAGLA